MKSDQVRVLLILSAVISISFFCGRNFSGICAPRLRIKDEVILASPAAAAERADPDRICTQNQYAKSLNMSLSDYVASMDDWLNNMIEREHNVVKNSYGPGWRQDLPMPHTHKRFDAFQAMGSCEMTCIGGECRQDTSKQVCGVDEGTMQAPCVVYSIGGNNQWEFELDVLKRTPCEVHTFDCTGSRKRFKKPDNPRLHFHYVCLGTKNPKSGTGEFWTLDKMTKTLGRDQIDLFKIDIEGYEWPQFSSWPILTDIRSWQTTLPMQVLVEVHYQSQMPELAYDLYDFKFPTDMIRLQEHFLRMGYAVVLRDDNEICQHCTELTLIRIKCPPTFDKGAKNTRVSS